MVGELIAAFIGIMCFAVIYRADRKNILLCGINASVTWLAYSLCLMSGTSTITASFISCLCMSVMARFLSVSRKVPATVFLMTGIFVLVPGAGMYYTIFNAFLNRPQEAVYHCNLTLKTALAIAFGIVLAYIIPQQFFVLKREKSDNNEN